MLQKTSLQTYTTYLVSTGVFLGIISSLGLMFCYNYMHPLWFILLLLMFGVQWLVFAFVAKYGQDETNTMLKQYQIAKYAKLFIYLIIMVIYVFTIKVNALAFLINFMAYYIVFTALEVWYIHKWMNTIPPTKE